MNQASIDVFVSYFGRPSLLYGGLGVLLAFVLTIVVLLVIRNGWTETLTTEQFDHSDLSFNILRAIFILCFFIAIIFA